MTEEDKYIGKFIVVTWMLLVFVALISCKTVQKSSSLDLESETNTESLNTTERKVSEAITTTERTVENNLRSVVTGGVIIYPRGSFTLDKFGTFNGEADSVVSDFTREIIDQSTSRDSTSVQENIEESKDSFSEINNNNLSIKKEEETKRTPSLVPYIGIAIAICVILWVLIWLIKKQFKLKL